MSAIFTTSDENLEENHVKEPIETKGSDTGNRFQGRGQKYGSRKRGDESKCSERWKKTSSFPILFFASVELGVTPGVGKKRG